MRTRISSFSLYEQSYISLFVEHVLLTRVRGLEVVGAIVGLHLLWVVIVIKLFLRHKRLVALQETWPSLRKGYRDENESEVEEEGISSL